MQITSAMKCATRAHRGQLDKGGKPYIRHPTRMARVGRLIHPEVEMLCWLHDVIEDTDYFKFRHPKMIAYATTMEHDLRERYGFSAGQARSLVAITKMEDEKHWDYMPRVKDDFVARITKVIDINDNLSPERLHCLPYADQQYLSEKYAHSRAFLLEVKGNVDQEAA